MKSIILNIDGNEYEFSYSKDFRILKKREDNGTEFYRFSSTAEWCPNGKIILKKSDLILTIKRKLGIV